VKLTSAHEQADLAWEWNNYYKYLVDENNQPLWKNYADYAIDRFGLPDATGVGREGFGIKVPLATNSPSAPSIPAGNGGGEGGNGKSEEPPTLPEPVLPPITWAESYYVQGAPDWWRGMTPDRNDPQSEYANLLNSMIPYMSPEDQRSSAQLLYRLYPQYFSSYNPTVVSMPTPTEVSTQMRNWMQSRARAEQMLGTLDKVKEVTKDKTFGSGYEYLKQLATSLRDFGGQEGQTRQQYANLVSALDPLLAETKGDQLSAFASMTRAMTQPYYTAGQVTPTTQLQSGRTIFGQDISNYF
jgi:hypothetical protein